MSGHTPGPWRVGEAIKDGRHGGVLTCIHADDWQELATVATWMEGDDMPEPSGEANARLIAASPDLLEALRRLTGAADDAAYSANIGMMDDAITAARAAIARATGEGNE